MYKLNNKNRFKNFWRWLKELKKKRLPTGCCISYKPSKSKDVVSYSLYYEKFPKKVTYESNVIDLGQATYIDLTLYLYPRNKYNIGIAAVDKVGNESDLQLLTLILKNKNEGGY